ncbi:hypothetical protein pdam_00007227 [Pocillopora damicornis]|uniref:BRCT domain-containing protein n=1 Tax=Pocillopora damicornis TaxID=46731 RepID=A0A3M6USD2_POCDA|nr:hypothetical protein pdam_00007227 [Pocillopora damicornis]
MAAKRLKIDQDSNGKVKRDDERNTTTKLADALIYIVPKKIPKARLQVLNNLAQKKGFLLSERFSDSVTHIVTGYETVDRVHAFLERQPASNVEVVNLDWLTDCITENKIVNVTGKVRIKSVGELSSQKSSGVARAESNKLEETSPNEYQDNKFVCQRATPLKHHNTKFTDALEILERHAVYVDSTQRDSRALAFRRAACALKSYPKQITRIEEASKLSSVGNHSKKEILENGSSDEVQDILSSEFFKTMEVFSSIYGCGPATARKWYEKGYRSIADVHHAVSDGMKLTEQQTMGFKYHSDLVKPVPKEEAINIKDIVIKELSKIQPNCIVELVGGYRRGKLSGHDVDILITHQNNSKVEGLLHKLVERLEKLDLMVGRNPHFESKTLYLKSVKGIGEGSQRQGGHMDSLDHCFCMFQMGKSFENEKVEHSCMQTTGEADETGTSTGSSSSEQMAAVVRRVDLIVAPHKQFPFALLGWTGSKQFNRSLRDYAWKVLKVKLSNHGMWDHKHIPVRQVEATSEQEIFHELKLEYRDPHDRNA